MNNKELIKLYKDEMNIINSDVRGLTVKARRGPSKETRIPLYVNENLSFFVATIIGDGHIKKDKEQTSIELSNKNLIELIRHNCFIIFERKFNICMIKRREGKKQTFTIYMDSKGIRLLLNHKFSIPRGKKSNIVEVPEVIKKSNKDIKAAFIAGIMLTEGGKRRRGFGLSSASSVLQKDLIQLLSDLGIQTSTDKWINKKNEKEYYGLVFKKENMNQILSLLKDEKILTLLNEFFVI
jgi:intein/homing endonuclease